MGYQSGALVQQVCYLGPYRTLLPAGQQHQASLNALARAFH